LSRDRLITAVCCVAMALGVFLLGVQTGRWLNQPGVKVEGIQLQYVNPAPTSTPAPGLSS
jgi:hypothetical protein